MLCQHEKTTNNCLESVNYKFIFKKFPEETEYIVKISFIILHNVLFVIMHLRYINNYLGYTAMSKVIYYYCYYYYMS